MKRLLLAALAAAVLTAAAPSPIAAFKDWRVACSNRNACVAWTAGDGSTPFLMVRRDQLPGAAPQVHVGLVTEDDMDVRAVTRWEVRTEGGSAARLEMLTMPDSGYPFDAAVSQDPAAARVFVEALKDSARVSLWANGRRVGEISLSGSSAALRRMDDVQGRVGTLDALVAKGPKPLSAVPKTPPEPTITPAPRVSQDRLPTALPPALAKLPAIAECGEESERGLKDPFVVRLGADLYLWGAPCFQGAYNYGYRFVIADGRGGHPRSPGFTDFEDLLVNPGWSNDSRGLSAFAKGRGLGDCGDQSYWLWDGRQFRLAARQVMDDCGGVPPDLWPVVWEARSSEDL